MQIAKWVVIHPTVIPAEVNLSFSICRGTMNRAPAVYSLLITGYCILHAITAVNLILYVVPSIVFDLLQMVHQLTDRLPSGSWGRQSLL